MTVGYAADIRPLFRDKDIKSMINYGGFDLSNYEDVSANAAQILKKLASGDMPCDGAWPEDQVALFRQWKDEGMAP